MRTAIAIALLVGGCSRGGGGADAASPADAGPCTRGSNRSCTSDECAVGYQTCDGVAYGPCQCTVSNPPPADLAVPPDLIGADLASTCPINPCPPCAQGETCRGRGAGGVELFDQVCLKACHSADGCQNGFFCAVLFDFPGYPVCVSESFPPTCQLAPGSSCDPGVGWTSCVDSQTLDTAFDDFPRTAVCGRKWVHCPNGCVDPSDGGAGNAHCR